MDRLVRRWCCAALLGFMVASAALVGCGEPQTPGAAARQGTAATDAGRRLFYIGLALYPESWSENDVVELAETLRETSKFQVVPMIASNAVSRPRRHPVADDPTIAAFVAGAAERATADDIVFVDISTHGSRDVLARKIGRGPETALTAHRLAEMLAPLERHRTIIVISACYSGSLIDELRAPRRIIITAARADRSSFGCAPGNRHTFFGQAELDAFSQGDRSLRQIFAAIREDVGRREQELRYTPSEPQVSVGVDVTALYDAPLF